MHPGTALIGGVLREYLSRVLTGVGSFGSPIVIKVGWKDEEGERGFCN
jgi:hypothetical protein